MRGRRVVPVVAAVLICTAFAGRPAVAAPSVWGPEHRLDSGIASSAQRPQILANQSGAALSAWSGNKVGAEQYDPIRVRDASGRFSATTVNSFESVNNAFLDEHGTAVVLRYNYQTDQTYSVTRRAGGAWSTEQTYGDGDVGGKSIAMSQSGYLGVVSAGPANTYTVEVRNPHGVWAAPVTLTPNAPVVGLAGLVVNDDGSAIAGFDSDTTYGTQHNCRITQVGGRNANGTTRPLVSLARRCAPTGANIDDARLTASSSGLGAVLSWTIKRTNVSFARFGVAVRTAQGTWVQRVMPANGGNEVAATVSAGNGYAWVWWAVQGERELSLYSTFFVDGRWSTPSRLRYYGGSAVRVVSLVSAVGTGQRIVAWTVQPRTASLYIARLRTVLNGAYHEEGLGGRTTVGDVSARGGHAALIEYKQDPGPYLQDAVTRYR